MRRLTFESMERLVQEWKRVNSPPKPFPGRRTPTRIGWRVDTRTYKLQAIKGKIQPVADKNFTSTYFGKPCKYRALELLQKMTEINRKPRIQILRYWTAEFDKSGVIAWRQWGYDKEVSQWNGASYFAYHPQVTSFTDCGAPWLKPVFVKRIGGLSVYSHQKKLSMDQIDKFYGWYEATFKKKLRRPKSQPLMQGSTEEATEL